MSAPYEFQHLAVVGNPWVVVPLLAMEQVLMDIASVKTEPMWFTEESFSGAVIGSHHLFRPCPEPLEAAQRSRTENAGMFCEFTAMNPYFQNILGHYEKILHEATPFSQAGEPDGLNLLARETATWYAGW
ncbi:MAG: hypothetical protein FWG17_03150 [Desulfovibrionaceae bacterium]|nr:hypothetical protein [Desulfovibrionaceae bacterium]